MSGRAIAYINLYALKHNLKQICNAAPTSLVLAMIKGNGYGHGLVRVAHALEDANGFGVATLEEALQLRKAGIQHFILLMGGFFDPYELEIISQQHLAIVIHSLEQVQIIEKISLAEPFQVWLKVDTGMHRLGFALDEVSAIHTRLQNCKNIRKPIGLITHLADADNTVGESTKRQLTHFANATANLPGPKSIANSAGIFLWRETHSDWIRPGIALYGATPKIIGTGADHHLLPAMTLSSRLIAIYKLKKGGLIGYGGTWCCPEDMLVGVAGIGYGDGYPRHAKSGTPVLVNDKQCSLVGRVNMDTISIDLRHYPEAKVGDKVILWGQGLPVEHVARSADTVPHQLLCNISQRVKFVEI